MSHCNSQPQVDIDQLIQGVLATGRITYRDKQRFLNLLLMSADTLTTQQLSQVRTVSDRLMMGLVKVTD